MKKLFGIAALLVSPDIGIADPAKIEEVAARQSGQSWSFSVTLSHGDTGWNDYADGWRVVLEDGTVLGTRTLLHPHVNEQPFTRSLSNIDIPEDVSTVFVEASTNVTGWDSQRYEFNLN